MKMCVGTVCTADFTMTYYSDVCSPGVSTTFNVGNTDSSNNLEFPTLGIFSWGDMSYNNVPSGGSCTPTLYRATVTDPNGLQEVREFDDGTNAWTTISSDSGNFGALLDYGN